MALKLLLSADYLPPSVAFSIDPTPPYRRVVQADSEWSS
jgi:hypothetical protein